MSALRERRANYDQSTIVVYQAFYDAIADAALGAGRFTAPLSGHRMSWIKPSFRWLMERSGCPNHPPKARWPDCSIRAFPVTPLLHLATCYFRMMPQRFPPGRFDPEGLFHRVSATRTIG